MRQYNDFDPVVHLLALKVVAPNFGKRLEVDFFQKAVFKSQNLKKKCSKSLHILNLKFEFPTHSNKLTQISSYLYKIQHHYPKDSFVQKNELIT